jgi:phosphonate transport system substrate-binding protein
VRLRLVSLMAPNADRFYRRLGIWLARQAGVTIEVVDTIPWQERERLLDRGEAQIGFICGLPYVRKADGSDPAIELLAAPVMAGARYRGRPIYFSDVVVRRESPYKAFVELRGASWSYNEPGSQSGYNLIQYHLATLGERSGYFSRVVEAGAHQTSLRMILDGEIDASAIDSTVLELELKLRPELAPHVRVIESLGPSPIPPAVVSRRLPLALREALRRALLGMHRDPEGVRILEAGMVARFMPVVDSDYDEIRRMAREAAPVRLLALMWETGPPISAPRERSGSPIPDDS